MPFRQRSLRYLILLSVFWLCGFDLSNCSLNDSSDGNSSSGGSSGFRVRVQDEQKISEDKGNFNGDLDSGDRFGSALAGPGDLESDGVRDLAVGAPFMDEGGTDRGGIWILFMDDNGQVDLEQKISGNSGGFDGNLDDGDLFGSALAGIGDLNGDGALDLVAGAPNDDEGGSERGALWVLFLNDQGRVRDEQKIAYGAGGFSGNLDDGDRFGSAVAQIGDIDRDGIPDLAVGAPRDAGDVTDPGEVWILFLNAEGRVRNEQRITKGAGGFSGDLDDGDRFGSAVAGIGDLDGDGTPDIAVGAPGDDGNGTGRGAVWILFLDTGGRVRDEQKIADGAGGFDGDLDDGDHFGSALAGIENFGSSRLTGLAVGAPNDDDGAEDAGAVWMLFPGTFGRADAWQKISPDAGNFDGDLDAGDHFGAAVARIGDLDNDGTVDLAVGAPGDDDGGDEKGATWVLFMDAN
jgi:hypothetical protein